MGRSGMPAALVGNSIACVATYACSRAQTMAGWQPQVYAGVTLDLAAVVLVFVAPSAHPQLCKPMHVHSVYKYSFTGLIIDK